MFKQFLKKILLTKGLQLKDYKRTAQKTEQEGNPRRRRRRVNWLATWLVVLKKKVLYFEKTQKLRTQMLLSLIRKIEKIQDCVIFNSNNHMPPPTLRNPLNQKHVRQNTHSLFKASFLHLLTVRKSIAFLTTSFPVEQQSKKSFFSV